MDPKRRERVYLQQFRLTSESPAHLELWLPLEDPDERERCVVNL